MTAQRDSSVTHASLIANGRMIRDQQTGRKAIEVGGEGAVSTA
jgi:hypothetical protein